MKTLTGGGKASLDLHKDSKKFNGQRNRPCEGVSNRITYTLKMIPVSETVTTGCFNFVLFD